MMQRHSPNAQRHTNVQRWRVASLMLAIPFALAACSPSSPGSDEAEQVSPDVEIVLGHHHSAGGVFDYQAQVFADTVDELTAGKIRVVVLSGGQLGSQSEAADGVLTGSMDATIVTSTQFVSVVPQMGIGTLPYVYDGWEHVQTDFIESGVADNLETSLAEQGGRILGWGTLGPRNLFFVDGAIDSLADMEGLLFRSAAASLYQDTFESFGMATVNVTWGEVYSALQTGLADGLDSPLGAALDESFDEVTGGIVVSEHIWGIANIVVNEELYQGLTDEQQDALKEAGAKASKAGTERAREDYEGATAKFEQAGLKIHELSDQDLSDMRAGTVAIVDEWVEENNAEELISKIRG